MPFANPLALLGLLSIIPLIVVYLIRPRPREVLFSSTIFLTEEKAERSAVLSRLITDPLFWMQLLVLCSLSIAAAGPYITEIGIPTSHLVVVVDLSASMEGNFAESIGLADPYLDDYQRISIVTAENIPTLALSSGSSAEARDTLARLQPHAVSADLSSAMVMANELLGLEGGNILVISDFISWEGDDPASTRAQLESKGAVSVVFAYSNKGGDNVAIVNGWTILSGDYANQTVQVHNYGAARTVPIIVAGPGGRSTSDIFLDRDKDYFFSFKAFPGQNRISLDLNDAIASDNEAYVYIPEQGQRNILYLGNSGPSLAALQSLPNVQVARSGDYQDFDLVVVSSNASSDGKLNRYIDGGGRVVYIAQSKNESPDYLPVRITGLAKGPVNLWVRSPEFASDIHFDEIGIFSYPEATARRQSVTVVEANGAPILSYWRLGKGMVVYNGLENDSDFYFRPEYPLFWNDMVRWLSGIPDISAANRKTGEIIPLGGPTLVETPQGVIRTSSLLLDEVGIYKFQGQTIAASMYNPRESDLSGGASYPSGTFSSSEARESIVNKDLTPWIIALAALALILEMAIIRWRRESK
jgi:Aerotolerance regulator N-terminal